MKVLVTGGNGFIGSFLLPLLIDNGFSVRCLVRQKSNLSWIQSLDVQYVYGDIRDRESLVQTVDDVDYVFHLAAAIRTHDWHTYNQTNHIGTKNLVETCTQRNPYLKRFVYVSSIAAAGPSNDRRIKTEDDPCKPCNDYGKTKLLGENAVRNLCGSVPFVIIRPPNVYGPGEREFFNIVRVVEKGIIPRFGNGEKQTTLCHVEDLVRGILLAATSGNAVGKTYYITDGSCYSYREIIHEIARSLGVSGLTLPLPHCMLIPIVSFLQLHAHMTRGETFLTVSRLRQIRKNYYLYSGEKAVRELGYRPRLSMHEGMRRSIEWYRHNRIKKYTTSTIN
jgi:nucleoside-diphosphate-sugar epimerase